MITMETASNNSAAGESAANSAAGDSTTGGAALGRTRFDFIFKIVLVGDAVNILNIWTGVEGFHSILSNIYIPISHLLKGNRV